MTKTVLVTIVPVDIDSGAPAPNFAPLCAATAQNLLYARRRTVRTYIVCKDGVPPRQLACFFACADGYDGEGGEEGKQDEKAGC